MGSKTVGAIDCKNINQYSHVSLRLRTTNLFCAKMSARKGIQMITLDSYKPKHPFLICCDSDGCAIDTMDIKHIQCFGPCLVKEFGLHEWENEILTRWNEINLYTITRGINRFKGLVLALKEIDEMYTRIEGFEMLYDWVETAKELSESALRKIIDINSNIIFKKALQWSQSVNESIDLLSMEDKKAFNGVK